MVQNNPFMIPLSKVATDIPAMDIVVWAISGYVGTSGAGGNLGNNRVVDAKKKKANASIALVAGISVTETS